jgi:glycosyltransferase involved in cell wall biosynthesis
MVNNLYDQKLSVIVPVYNGGERIEKCLKSILEQTYLHLEIIVIDDGSKDDSFLVSKKVLEKYNKNNFTVKLETQENKGAACTRNKGIMMASGEWVTFVDQDDYITPDYCEQYMRETDENQDIVVGGYERVSDSGKVLRKVVLSGTEWDAFMVVAPWAHFYRKDFLVDNKIQFLSTYIGEDVYFNMVAYSHTSRIKILSGNCDYKWVNNKDSVSNSRQNRVTEKNNPLFLLRSIHEEYSNHESMNCISHDIREYYFLRYVVWYALFTVRGSDKRAYRDRINELFSWLQETYPEYRKNCYLRHRMKGEARSIYLAVLIVTRLH